MKKKILVVEDSPDMAQVLQSLLGFMGYNSVVATNAKQAVEMAAAHLPDLIMLDIMLPGVDGLEAAREIRQNPKTHSIPILAVTAKTSFSEKEECLKNGCNEHIAKPFTRNQLGSCIERLLK